MNNLTRKTNRQDKQLQQKFGYKEKYLFVKKQTQSERGRERVNACSVESLLSVKEQIKKQRKTETERWREEERTKKRK